MLLKRGNDRVIKYHDDFINLIWYIRRILRVGNILFIYLITLSIRILLVYDVAVLFLFLS